MTPDQAAEMLAMLRVDLGIMGTTAYDSRFAQLLQAADAAIRREGAAPDYTSPDDRQLCVMYAAWLWRRRDNQGEMPRMLRYQLNQKVLGDKARGTGE